MREADLYQENRRRQEQSLKVQKRVVAALERIAEAVEGILECLDDGQRDCGVSWPEELDGRSEDMEDQNPGNDGEGEGG